MRVCVAFLLRVSVAVLLELTELAKPVEMPCLCCNTRGQAWTCSKSANRTAVCRRSASKLADTVQQMHTVREPADEGLVFTNPLKKHVAPARMKTLTAPV